MKKYAWLVLVVVGVFPVAWAADETPDDQFFKAATYALEAETARSESDWTGAHTKYAAAQAILHRLRKAHPEWNPQVVEYRIRTYRRQMEDLQPFLSNDRKPVLSGGDDQKVQLLTEQLQTAEDKLGQLEVLRQELSNRLQAQERNVASVTADKQELQAKLTAAVERAEMLVAKTVDTEELNAKLSEMRAEVDRLNGVAEELQVKVDASADQSKELENAHAKLKDVTAQVGNLETQLADANGKLAAELKSVREQAAAWEQSSVELQRVRTDLSSLTQQNAQLKGQLTVAEAKIEALRLRAANLEIADLRNTFMELGAQLGKGP